MIAETTAYGLTFSYPAGDTVVGRCLRDHGEFGRVEAALAGQLAAGATFLDVGANIGAIALPVARRAREVVAVEAHPGLADLLRHNAAANGLSNVRVVEAAVSDAPGEVAFPTPPLTDARNFGDNGLAAPRAEAVTTSVRAVTIDEIATPDTRIVKVDVQGHEAAVLRGAQKTLEALRPAWIIEVGHDTPRAREVIACLASQGYRAYWFFSPFVTRTAARNPQKERRLMGDTNIAAFPLEGPQPLDMSPVDLAAGWPSHVRDFPYLRRYGFAQA